MNKGQIISGAAHLGLIGWALLGGLVQPAPPPFAVTEVTAVTPQQYDAIMARQQPPQVTPDITPPEPPQTRDKQPQPKPRSDETPKRPQAPAQSQKAEPDAAPEAQTTPPPRQAEVSDIAPKMPPPPEDVAVLAPDVADQAQPREVPRVAPQPVAPPKPDIRKDEVVRPETAPAPSDTSPPTPPEEASAPRAATTKIVTEADQKPARAAPSRSLRPKERPERQAKAEPPKPKPDTTKTRAPEEDAVNSALAQALSGGQTDSPQRTLSAPQLSTGERDALRVAVQQCWNVGSLSSEALAMTVVVGVKMSEDGRPISGSLRMIGATGSGSDAAAQQAYEAARRAILRCGARGFDLPRDKYDAWRDIEMTFNPEKMRKK